MSLFPFVYQHCWRLKGCTVEELWEMEAAAFMFLFPCQLYREMEGRAGRGHFPLSVIFCSSSAVVSGLWMFQNCLVRYFNDFSFSVSS